MNDMELYFARQNILWNIGKYILLIICIISIILYILDIISRIKYSKLWNKFLKTEHKRIFEKKENK